MVGVLPVLRNIVNDLASSEELVLPRVGFRYLAVTSQGEFHCLFISLAKLFLLNGNFFAVHCIFTEVICNRGTG